MFAETFEAYPDALETHPGLVALSVVYDEQVANCTRCERSQSRKQLVYGMGATEDPRLGFVTEVPSLLDDRRGYPFAGEPGDLLKKGVEALGWSWNDVYSCLLVSCRSKAPPTAEQVKKCRPVFDSQILSVRPKVLYVFGERSAQTLLGKDLPLERLRGEWHSYDLEHHQCPVRVTYRPQDVLDNPSLKQPFWEDLLEAPKHELLNESHDTRDPK